MSRLSFRPRPLDIDKKLPIVKSTKGVADDDAPASTTRNSQLLRAVPEIENEVWIHPGVFVTAPCFPVILFLNFLVYATMLACLILGNYGLFVSVLF